jgi:hypothetical protein
VSFDAKMGTNFLKGDLQLPTGDEPLENINRSRIKISAEESLRRQFAERIAHQQPPDRHRGQTRTVPDSRAGGDLNNTIGTAVPEGDSMVLPTCAGIVQHLRRGGQALSFDRWSSAARSSGRCGGIEIGVEAQSGDDADIITDDTEEIDGGERSVSDDDNAAAWQPGWICNTTWRDQSSNVLGERGLSA